MRKNDILIVLLILAGVALLPGCGDMQRGEEDDVGSVAAGESSRGQGDADEEDTAPEFELLEEAPRSFEYPLETDEPYIIDRAGLPPPGNAVPNSEYNLNRAPDLPPVYRVWYGTDREPIDGTDHSNGFTGQRDTSLAADQLHYGRCYVQVPKSHKFGSIGSSWFMRWFRWTDDRLVLESIEKIPGQQFFTAMRSKLNTRNIGERRVLLYIHGFNNSFDDAAIRAAQIGYDLKVEGITALFSWPSRDATRAYTADEATIGASEPHLEIFLTRLIRESGAEQIDVIAHSMGNRGFLRVLARMASVPEFNGASKPFNQILLAAPDVDIQTFKNLAAAYPQLSNRTTLYVSSKDRALRGSGIIHDHPRAGFVPPITVLDGIDTIEVSAIDLTLLGHAYHGDAEAVLYDMFQLLRSNSSPDTRLRIVPATSPAGAYWKLQ